jgi:L-ribulose-5-phosphate 3-epimerase
MDRLPISLAEWALVEEIRAGTLSTLGFPRVARQDFDLDAVELVNTLFGVPTLRYLAELKSNAESEGTRILLIMVDDEGDGCSQGKKDREQFWIHHRKWVDIAQFLGCQAIRTNCRGPENASPSEALEWAADSYHPLLAYAEQANIRVLVENHGGFSDYADWMLALIKKIDHPGFGSYPDWRTRASLQ